MAHPAPFLSLLLVSTMSLTQAVVVKGRGLGFVQPLLTPARLRATSLQCTSSRRMMSGRSVRQGLRMTATQPSTNTLSYLEELGIESVKADTPRLRFAPSPTGSLHVGGARTALYNYLAAAKNGGKFVLRIEDTDVARSTKESEESMIADLKWLGLEWDEGPFVGGPAKVYRQSERSEIYVKMAKKLVELGHAYPCFCTEEELDAKRKAAEVAGSQVAYDGTWRDADPEEVQRRIDAGETYTYRFKVPKGKVVAINDLVRGVVRWDVEATLGDFILLRSTGVPVYNFCVAVDDALMGVTTVARAEEHLTNTVRQVLVLEALGFPIPQYAHCSLILGEDRSKLSKRHGATSCNQFRENGFLPEAMINYLALLGWNDGTDKDVYTREELIQAFDLSRVTASPAMFDMVKLRWINGQHLRAMEKEKLEPMISELFLKNKLLSAPSDAFVKHVTGMVQEKCELVNDALTITKEVLGYQFEHTTNDENADSILADDFGSFTEAVVESHNKGEMPLYKFMEPDFDKIFKDWVTSIGKDTGRKGKRLFMPMRLAITGNLAGPDIGDQVKAMMLGNEIGAAGVVLMDERMKILSSWVKENADTIAKKHQDITSDVLPDGQVANAISDVVKLLGPLQQRTVLALAKQLLETHPPVAGAADAGAAPVKAVPAARNLDRSGNVEPVTRLDIRVGKIISCKPHPDADSLYVEEIDVGDADGPRTVISGLANFIPIEEMEGRTVAVVCNLKPAKMRGIESNGMVLCGSDGDKTKVELLEPAEGSVIGERLALEGYGILIPADEDAVLKSKSQQKVWGMVAPDMKTDAQGRATYRGGLFSTSKGPLTCKTLTSSTVG